MIKSTDMKDTIRNVLEKYAGTQANLDSLALREMIADEIADELQRKGIRMINYHVPDYVDDDLSL